MVKTTKQVLDKLELENRTTTKITSKERDDRQLWDAIKINDDRGIESLRVITL